MSKTVSQKSSAKGTKKKSPSKAVVSAEKDVQVVDAINAKTAEEINLDLEESLDKLLDEKQQFVREDAIDAKKKLDDFQNRLTDNSMTTVSEKPVDISGIDGFSENVRILTEVFRRSRFDEYLSLLANPQRVLGINILIGFFRGVGLSIGIAFVSAVVYYLYQTQF